MKKILLSIVVLLSAFQAKADEGMWTLYDLPQAVYQQMQAEGITPLVSYCYLLFILLYFPCIATIVAIKHETGSWRWATFAAVYTTAVAWIVSFVVYHVGTLFC